MKRNIYAIKFAAVMMSVVAALPAWAVEHQRVPATPPFQSAEDLQLKKERQGFLNFIGDLRSHSRNAQVAKESSQAPAVAQRPAKIYRAPWEPEASLFGVVPQVFGMSSYYDAYWGSIDIVNGMSTPIYRGIVFTNREDCFMQGGVVRDGILYIPCVDYGEEGMVTQEFTIAWRRYDLNLGKELSQLNFGNSEEGMKMFMYGMTYDPSNDIIYGLSYDNSTEIGGGLCMIDASKPESQWTPVTIANVGGTATDWMSMICYCPLDETLYGLSTNGILYTLDVDSKNRVPVKEFDPDDMYEYGCFPSLMESTPAIYSPRDKSIIFITTDQSGNAFGNSIDMESYDGYALREFAPMQTITTLYCTDPYADEEGPNVVENLTIDFADASLSGTFSFTAPTTLFNGLQISGSIEAHLLVDKEEVFSTTVGAGETVSGNLTLEQGMHTFTVYCTYGDNKGAETTRKIYVGNDVPMAPTSLSYLNGTLSWKAPAAMGVNSGYLDLSGATYNVYVDGELQNTAPIAGCSYAIDLAVGETKRRQLQVSIVANGVESGLSEVLSRTCGKGFELPYTTAPTTSESKLFETYNINNDSYYFQHWSLTNQDPYWLISTTDYTVSPDDWLIMPPVYLESADDIYTLVVAYENARANPIQKDNLDICIGTDPTPEAMTNVIYSHREHIQASYTDLSTKFVVERPGTYYIGFHSLPGDDTFYRGIKLKNFRLSAEGGSSTAPGEATDVTLTAAPLGELFVTIDATLPTVDMSGRALDPSDDLTLTAACGSDSRTATGKPGDKVELIIPVDIDGFNDVHISVANSEGHGNARLYTVYAGIDNPLPPTNVKGVISEDNLSMTVTWDAVGNVGEHGGYVDVDGVTYDFYNGSTTGFTRVGTAGKNLSYTYRGVLGSQIQVNVGPVAVNFVGTSSNGTFITETLGSLNKIPMIEEWGMAAFTYNKWVSSTTAPYNFVTWSHCTEASSELGDITFNGGALRATNAGASKALGQLVAPRLTTRDVNHVKAVMTYWNYAKAGHMELWGRTYENQEPVKIAELDPSRPAVGEWVEWEVVLPEEFCNQAWIQVNVRCEIASDESVVLENYQILQNVEYDLQVSNVTAPYCAVVGETPTFNVVVNNAGAETISGNLNVELIANGDIVLESVSTPIERLSSGKDFEFDASFKMLESYTKYDFIEVRATTEADDDENKTNNEASAEFLLYEHTVPVVRDLSAVRADNGQDVNLTWTTPDNTYSSIESFEVSQPLANTEEIGRWINVDMDGMAPFTIQGNRWSGDEDPSAWVVYNAKDRNTMSDERLSPHSGDQMLLCRSIQYEDGEYPTRSFDFLVSPEVKGGSKVTFWMNTISSTYAETIDIYYSTTDTNLTGTEFDLTNKDQGPTECGSFKLLRHFTKSGSEGWEKCEFTLPADAKHFAFVYASFGMFAAMIDDVEYEPVTPGTVDIDSYDVFISYVGETPVCISREVTGTSYTHVTGHDRAATYYVVTNVYDGEYRFQGPLSNPASVDGSGVNELDGGRFVGGGKGRILVGGAEGVACRIFDAEGRTINVATISSDRQVFIVDAGIYLVQLGDDTVKVIVR